MIESHLKHNVELCLWGFFFPVCLSVVWNKTGKNPIWNTKWFLCSQDFYFYVCMRALYYPFKKKNPERNSKWFHVSCLSRLWDSYFPCWPTWYVLRWFSGHCVARWQLATAVTARDASWGWFSSISASSLSASSLITRFSFCMPWWGPRP